MWSRGRGWSLENAVRVGWLKSREARGKQRNNKAKEGKRSAWERGSGGSPVGHSGRKGSTEDDDRGQRRGENDGWEPWQESHTLRWSVERQRQKIEKKKYGCLVFCDPASLGHNAGPCLLVDSGRTQAAWSYYSLCDVFDLESEK